MDKWQTWCMRRTENPEKVIRFHSCPQTKITQPVAQFGRASEYESEGLRFESLQVVKWECAGVGEPGQTVNLVSSD